MKKALPAIVLSVLGMGAALLFLLRPWQDADEETAFDRPPVSVDVSTIRLDKVQSRVFAEGTARASRREYMVFEKAGRIVHVKPGQDGGDLREGERVKEGELLARQDQRVAQAALDMANAAVEEANRQVAIVEAELKQAEAEHELARAQLRRKKTARDSGAITEQEYDQAVAEEKVRAANVIRAKNKLEASRSSIVTARARVKQAEVELELTEIRSPIDGTLAYINIKKGYYYTPSILRTDSESNALGTVPMVIIDASRFEVTVHIPTFHAERIRVGQSASIHVGSASPGTAAEEPGGVPGSVFSVNPAVNPGGRYVEVKIRTNEGVGGLKDGGFVSCWIATEQRENVVAVPLEALLYRENEPHVFVVDPESGAARERKVELGIRDFLKQEVLSGLKEGERVVTGGRYQLVNGSPLTILEGGDK